MAKEPDKPEQLEETHARGLSKGERWAASLFGVAGVGAGGVGVFLSDNQAGTTAILLLGAVFLLMGVQGTAIIKAGKDSVELERRAAVRRIADKAAELVEEKEPAAAAELVRAAREVYPSASDDRNLRDVDEQIYELEVFNAVTRAMRVLEERGVIIPGDEVGIGMSGKRPVDGPDIRVEFADYPTRSLGIEVKHTMRVSFGTDKVIGALEQFKKYGVTRGLIVTNRPPTTTSVSALESLGPPFRFGFVRWQSPDDDEQLVEALADVLKE